MRPKTRKTQPMKSVVSPAPKEQSLNLQPVKETAGSTGQGIHSISVKASRNLVTPGGKVYFAAEYFTPTGEIKDINPRWSVEPLKQGIYIDSQGVLTVSRNVVLRNDEKLLITARANGAVATREIALTKKDPFMLATRVHYFRYSGNYGGWNVWGWNQGSDARQFNFSESTDLGRIAGIDRDYFIIRYSEGANAWAGKDTGDIRVKNRQDIYIVEGDGRVFFDFREATRAARPRIISAVMDSGNLVTAHLTTVPPEGATFELHMNGKKLESTVTFGKTLVFNVNTDYAFNPAALFEIRASKGFSTVKVTMRRVLDSFYYPGDDMGVTFAKDRINLRVWAPTAATVSTMLYGDFKMSPQGGKEIPMTRDAASGTWTVSLNRRQDYGKFFLYKVVFYPGTPYEKVTYVVDPYAFAVSVNGQKGALIDIKTDPETICHGWKPDRKPPMVALEDAILYELHVRDLSIDENSGVKPDFRGKFMAFTQPGTAHPHYRHVKTGIEHIQELGVTHVHLLPVYDFATVDEANPNHSQFNWGYDPKNYNVPEGSYSTNPFDPKTRIREFRHMVQALHDRNIRVVMDVVYNHTYSTDVFENLVPCYYYRTDEHCRFTNGSGCGNEVASERPMVRKFIIDSVKHWARDYNVDGFRFDLMGLIDIETVKQVVQELRAIDPTILVYGEPWCGGSTYLSGELQVWKGKQRGLNFAVFNDNFRNVLRGNNDTPHPSRAYVTGDTSLADNIFRGVTGSIHDFTLNPGETVNYAAAHDNYVLWDQIIAASGHKFPYPYRAERNDYLNPKNEINDQRVRRALLANGIVLTSQGIPFIHAGDEIVRTKFGDHNSYKSPDAINKIRWDWKKDNNQVFNYYRGLIQLRRDHPAFRLRTREQIESSIERINAPGKMVAFVVKNHANNDRWRTILVAYNPHVEPLTLCLPDGAWTVVVNDREAGSSPVKTGVKTAHGCVAVPALSMMVMYDVDRESK